MILNRMFSLKFLVNFILLSLFGINNISGQWNKAITDNRIDDKAYDNYDVDNGTDISLLKLLPLKATSLSDIRTLDRRQGKQNATADDEFQILISGGYRPKTNTLVQFLVSLRSSQEFMIFGDNHFCGGSIISKRVILTAAHCLSLGNYILSPEEIVVVAGTPRRLLKTANTQILAVQKVIQHPNYNSTAVENDIGILKLKDDITVKEGFVNIISIADSARNIGTKCNVLGWGQITQFGPLPDEVLTADMTIRDESECTYEGGPIPKNAICANNENDFEISGCFGDSGGPLFCNNKLVGIVVAVTSCGQTETPTVFADVYKYRKWIAKNAAASIRRSSSMVTIEKLMLLLLAIIKLAITKMR